MEEMTLSPPDPTTRQQRGGNPRWTRQQDAIILSAFVWGLTAQDIHDLNLVPRTPQGIKKRMAVLMIDARDLKRAGRTLAGRLTPPDGR